MLNLFKIRANRANRARVNRGNLAPKMQRSDIIFLALWRRFFRTIRRDFGANRESKMHANLESSANLKARDLGANHTQIANLNSRANHKNLLFIFCVYCLACLAIILAHFNYVDDAGRILDGYFFNWDRHTSTALGALLSLNHSFFITLFPLTLFLALAFLSLASFALIFIVNKNLLSSKIALLGALPLGISPYFLENLSYKFDAPFMALSVLAAIFPFIFIRSARVFVMIATICLLIVLTSYQASIGVYCVVAIFCAFQKLIQNSGVRAIKSAVKVAFASIFAAFLACAVFKAAIHTAEISYVGNEILPRTLFFSGVAHNIQVYFEMLWRDFSGNNFVFLSLVAVFCALFILQATCIKRALFLPAILTLALMLVFSFGYIILAVPSFYARSFIGFGAFVSIIALFSISLDSRVIRFLTLAPNFILAWYLISFATFYGNSLKAHGDYEKFRFSLVARDLSDFLDDSHRNEDGKFHIVFLGDAGASPNFMKARAEYPVLARIVPRIQHGYRDKIGWGVLGLAHYGIQVTLETFALPKDAKILRENYYHTIYLFKVRKNFSEFSVFAVDFKNRALKSN